MPTSLHRMDDAGHRLTRFDRGTLGEPKRTPEGYLITEARIARPGILTYRNADGSTRRELVTRETLADAAALDTLRHKPVTLEHPPEMVGPEGVRRVEVGNITGNVRVDDDGAVVAEIVVRDAEALAAIQQGVREVSPGYDLTGFSVVSGVDPEHGPYDAIQTGRTYNHLAITRGARGGATIRLRADAAYDIRLDAGAPAPQPPHREDTMNPLLLALIGLGLTQEAAEAGLPAVSAAADKHHRADSEAKDARVQELETENADLKAKAEAHKARFDALGVDPDKDDDFDEAKRFDAFLAAHRERATLEALAKAHRVDSAELDKPDAELRKAILAKARPEMDLTGKDEAYIRAAVDMLPGEQAARKDSAFDSAFRRDAKPREDATDKPTLRKNPALASYQAAHDARLGG